MKDKFLITSIMAFLINGCNSQVNTTDPQISKNIETSKKKGVFVKQYIIDNSTDPDIVIVDAWTEKTWFYEVHDGKTVQVEKYGCKLCFNLKQTPNLKYSRKNMGNWLIEYKPTGTYVGVAYDVYALRFRDCNIPDIISLDLINRTDSNSVVTDKKVGTLTFKAIENIKKK